MSDQSPGPGWWLASDGKWYPPQGPAEEPVYQAMIPASSIPAATWPVLGGAGLLGIGALLPWATVTAPLVGQISKNGIDGDGVLTLLAGVAIAVLGFVVRSKRKASKGLGIPIAVVALFAGLIGIWDLVDIAQASTDLVVADAGIGLYLTNLGAGSAVVGGIMLSLDKDRGQRF